MNCSLSGSSVHGDSSGKNTGVGCQFLFQGVFPTQGSNPCLLPWKVDSLPLNHKESFWFSLINNKGMATHFSVLAWRISWTEDQAGYSPWVHGVIKS